MSYAYAPDPGALARDLYDGQIHQLDAWAYVWYDGTYLWYWTNNNWDAAYNVAHGWFFVWTGTTNIWPFADNSWNYCDWGQYWEGHGQYILGCYHDWGGGDTDWLFELHDVTTNTAVLDWACFNLGTDNLFNPVDHQLLFASQELDGTWEYTDPDTLVVWNYDSQLHTVSEFVDAIGTLASLYGQWDVVAIGDAGNVNSFLIGDQWITPINYTSFYSDFVEWGSFMSNSANTHTGDAMVQFMASSVAATSGGQAMLSTIQGWLGCYLFASDDPTGWGASGDVDLEWPGLYGQYPNQSVPYDWLVYMNLVPA